MNKTAAAWGIGGFCVALLMGAAAVQPEAIGRWRMHYKPDSSLGSQEVVLFDTATGAVWILPLGSPADDAKAAKVIGEKIRGSWIEVFPGR
jgi:hypothetical protein